MSMINEVTEALQCMSSNVGRAEKDEALQYLENFQRSNDAWLLCLNILNNLDVTLLELHIFASQTIRNKVTYDLNQLSDPEILQFKDSILNLLSLHQNKVILTQLNVALARLAIQLLSWKNPINEIINFLEKYPGTLLIFFKILPEETLDIGSIPLTEDEYNSRVHELLETISDDIIKFLVSCLDSLNKEGTLQSQRAKNSATDITTEQILRCLSSWSFEFPIDKLLMVEPLIKLVFESVLRFDDDIDVFNAGIDCLCIILKESRDSPNENLILALFEQLISLQHALLPNIEQLTKQKMDDEIDPELLEGLTRIFVEAGEAWVVSISKSPQVFYPIVQTLLILTCSNPDLDIVSYTFPFWFNFKQNLVLTRYRESRIFYKDAFIQLINGIIDHLQYPLHEFSTKENEDKFKEFRYTMGDVLKDCTAVVGAESALSQPFDRIQQNKNSANWQSLEAPLFSLRTMAKEIPKTESKYMPQLIDIICNLSEHPKIRYAVTLVLGRYTEWTSKNPAKLEQQLQYIFDGFELVRSSAAQDSKQILEIITASSRALMYFCSDCSTLLSEYIDQLLDFYFKIQDILSRDIESQFEFCQGLSAVINKQPIEKINIPFAKMVNDILEKIEILMPQWKLSPTTYNIIIADRIDLIYALFEELHPKFEYPQEGQDPLLQSIETIWNALRIILIDQGAISDDIIVERTTKLLRRLFERYHVFCEPILASVAEFLVNGYAITGYGSFLWCSGSLIVIFGDDESFPISPQLKEATWQFALSQCGTFVMNFNKMNKDELNKYYEIIMDFFAMISDLVMFYPREFIMSTELLENIVDVALESINKIETYDAYVYILRSLDDIISWGFKVPPISSLTIDEVPEDCRQQILNQIVIKRGSKLIVTLFHGLVSIFEDSSHSDAITCIVKCFRLATDANNGDASVCTEWICEMVNFIGQVSPKEKDNLLKSVITGLNGRDYRKVRESIRVFVDWHLRKTIGSRMS